MAFLSQKRLPLFNPHAVTNVRFKVYLGVSPLSDGYVT